MKNIIFIAPPAAGKGTISSMIVAEYNIPHISTGDLLRDEIKNQTKLGSQIKDKMAKGEFISDDIITKLLKKRLTKSDIKKGFILDGYPRNILQAKVYEKLLEDINYDLGVVIYLNIDKELAMERALSRIICPKCGLSYNLNDPNLSPRKENTCDSCGSKLTSRSDDSKETFIKRFDTYMSETFPLVEYYKEKNNLVTIDVTNKSASEVFEEVKKVLK